MHFKFITEFDTIPWRYLLLRIAGGLCPLLPLPLVLGLPADVGGRYPTSLPSGPGPCSRGKRRQTGARPCSGCRPRRVHAEEETKTCPAPRWRWGCSFLPLPNVDLFGVHSSGGRGVCRREEQAAAARPRERRLGVGTWDSGRRRGWKWNWDLGDGNEMGVAGQVS
jgi:hypothetical protein